MFFFNDTATTEIYTLSLHDALPIWRQRGVGVAVRRAPRLAEQPGGGRRARVDDAVLPRCRPRHVAVARRCGSPAAGPRRGPRTGAGPLVATGARGPGGRKRLV